MMNRFLYWGKSLTCRHHYVVIDHDKVPLDYPGNFKPKYTCMCTNCGKVKKFSCDQWLIIKNRQKYLGNK